MIQLYRFIYDYDNYDVSKYLPAYKNLNYLSQVLKY